MAIDLWKGEQFVYEGYGHEDDRESRSSHESDHQDPHREHHQQQQQRHLHRDEHEPHFYVPAVPPLSSEKDREPVSSSDEVSFSRLVSLMCGKVFLDFLHSIQKLTKRHE